jgi:hypothetical protein
MCVFCFVSYFLCILVPLPPGTNTFATNNSNKIIIIIIIINS